MHNLYMQSPFNLSEKIGWSLGRNGYGKHWLHGLGIESLILKINNFLSSLHGNSVTDTHGKRIPLKPFDFFES